MTLSGALCTWAGIMGNGIVIGAPYGLEHLHTKFNKKTAVLELGCDI
jgi:hypothetical protein